MPNEPDNSFEKTVRIHRPDDRLFDRFVLKRRLGQGGMGVVWLARDERLEIDVALKVLPDALRFDEGALAQLKQEAQKCIRLTHARIIRVFDFLVSDELAAISMEYVDGPTLAKLRAEQPEGVFDAEEIKDWVTQIGEALIHAHEEARIVHRDLKPGNVMIDAAGRAKVADFGIARTLGGTMTATSQNEFVTGTLAYMGPQQLRGDRPTAQDDIYALGALIYELLTGKPPFYSGDVCQQIETQQSSALGTAPAGTETRRQSDPRKLEQDHPRLPGQEAGRAPGFRARSAHGSGPQFRSPPGNFRPNRRFGPAPRRRRRPGHSPDRRSRSVATTG